MMPRRRRHKPRNPLERENWVYVHGQDPVKWAKRWGIETQVVPCGGCSKPREMTVAFFSGELRGLVAPRCECDEELPPYCLVHAKGDLLEYLKDLS